LRAPLNNLLRRTIGLGVAWAALVMTGCAPVVVVSDWKQIGPGPILDPGTGLINAPGGTVSGLVTDIAIDPSGTTDNIIYIATDAGGIWKSSDGGKSWTPKTDFMPAISMGAVALDPTNPSTVYAGSGSLFNLGDFNAAGVYKSTDGGDNWQILDPNGVFTPASGGIGIDRMVLPNSDTLLVGTGAGLYRLTNGGRNAALVLNGVVSDLKLDTGSSAVYAAVAGAGIFKSTDAGLNFAQTPFFSSASNGLPRGLRFGGIVFAQSTKFTGNTFYAAAILTAGQPLAFCGGPFANPGVGLYKSTDGGQTWSEIKQGPEVIVSLQTQGVGNQTLGYDLTLGVDPQDSQTFYYGLRGLYAATDGGASGLRDNQNSSINGAPNPCPPTQDNRIDNNKGHADHHAIAFSPASHFGGKPTRVYLGNDGGLISTADMGTTYSYLNEGLSTVLMTWLDIGRGSAANNVFSYGTAQDNGLFSHTPAQAGIHWIEGKDNDGRSVAVDPLDPKHALGTDGTAIYTTTDGQNWTSSSLPPGRRRINIGLIVFDPNGKNVYLSNGTLLYQSKDNGSTFSLMTGFSQTITAIGQSKSDSNTVWLGLSNGNLQFTNNAVAGNPPRWSAPSAQPPGIPGQRIAALAVDPIDAKEIVVVYPGFSKVNAGASPSQHVFQTRDGGATWFDVSGTVGGGFQNLPDLPLYSVVIDSNTNPHTIIVAGDGGVFQTTGFGFFWQKLGTGLPNAQMVKLALDDSARPKILRVASWGRGAFEMQFTPPPPPCSGPVNACGGCSTLQAPVGVQCEDRATGQCGFFACVGTDSVTCDTSHGLKNACGGCSPMAPPGVGFGAAGDHCTCHTPAEEDGTLVCARDGNHLICCPCDSAPGCGPGSP
jgi:photosystem II stability/assembly factor-like uncharacterized protein